MQDRSPLRFTPRHDRVVIEKLPPPPPRPGVLLQPDSQRKPPKEGIVRAVGADVRPDLEPGVHVLFAEFSGSDLDIDDEIFLVLRDEEIIGIRPTGRSVVSTEKPVHPALLGVNSVA